MGFTTPGKPAVLFVCLGNICRSPMAEGALREAARKAGIVIDVGSVGTADYHIGEIPDQRAIATARRHGVDIAMHRARQLCEDDFDRFTHIFAMDRANVAGINARAPRHASPHIALLLDVIPDRRGEPVADPYHGDENDFEACWQTIDEAIAALVDRLGEEAAARDAGMANFAPEEIAVQPTNPPAK